MSAAPAQSTQAPKSNSKVGSAPRPAPANDDVTPPPTRNPLLGRKPGPASTDEAGDSGDEQSSVNTAQRGALQQPPIDEAKVEISESLLGDESADADADGTNVRAYPPPQRSTATRPAPAPARPSNQAGQRTLPPTRGVPPKR